MVGGFTEWAHLRLRDHRPGPMNYDLTVSDAPKRSILGKYPIRQSGSGVGPGQYCIPSTIGDCRSTILRPPVAAVPGNADRVSPKRPSRSASKGRAAIRSVSETKKYLADAPAFSIYGKLKDITPVNLAGPGDYDFPSTFGAPGKGPTFGKRTKLLTTRDIVPGPATYDVPRFGDEKPKGREIITAIERKHKTDTGPGPGSYDDPTTIAARIARTKRFIVDVPTFGVRPPTPSVAIHRGPGPAQYGDVSRIMTKTVTRTPIFREPTVRTPKSEAEVVKEEPVSDGNLPSDFDYTYSKGVSFGPRSFVLLVPSTSDVVGPGSYDLSKVPHRVRGGRFAQHPYDLHAAAKALMKSREVAVTGGGPMYNPNIDAVKPVKSFCIPGFGAAKRFCDQTSTGSNFYNIRPLSPGRSTVFYRGDYNKSAYLKGQESSKLMYNVKNGTIAEGVEQGKGVTFGIRYPARATHQVCKPYDETTNINCVYADEMTWLVGR
ncbi:hypothetical protein, conserved [Trypanosoma brucei brucei TREU927]|uniref:Sperm-tail PG-rich repeat n=1 Tax=Trypanosoma brucei brucei (strain 927/4 GUTat10.1) TaxID=185431 RepID=Q38BK8_TRYB2|nr:hypothetical protein, conserved [Trypanosoma brucei brucei TREU927]EAN77812.1 hypothetical protein, conserved [Trypanosoma brucei brucei TREU927]